MPSPNAQLFTGPFDPRIVLAVIAAVLVLVVATLVVNAWRRMSKARSHQVIVLDTADTVSEAPRTIYLDQPTRDRLRKAGWVV